MSFILDALRKSENERQRGSVPDIARIPLARPAQRPPRWAIALMALLAATVVALTAAWWQAQREDLPNAMLAPERAPAPADAISPPTAPTQEPRPASTAEALRPAAITARAAAAQSVVEPRDVAAPTVTEARAPTVAGPATGAEPPPSLAQLRASGIDVPPLELQLHSYSEATAGRFVFINGARYSEGETLAAGPRVVRITQTGVVLDQRGREFLLTVD